MNLRRLLVAAFWAAIALAVWDAWLAGELASAVERRRRRRRDRKV